MCRFVLLICFSCCVQATLIAQQTLRKHSQKPRIVLNTNRSLSAARAKRALFEKTNLTPSDFDSIAISHRLRFVELYLEKNVIGQLGSSFITALFDLSNDKLISRSGFRVRPSEKNPKMILTNIPLIEDILKKENILDMDVPINISNVFASDLGVYFDMDFILQDTLIRSHVDYRHDTQKSRIIVYDK